jgi:hypothetical protein
MVQSRDVGSLYSTLGNLSKTTYHILTMDQTK